VDLVIGTLFEPALGPCDGGSLVLASNQTPSESNAVRSDADTCNDLAGVVDIGERWNIRFERGFDDELAFWCECARCTVQVDERVVIYVELWARRNQAS